MFAEGSIKGRSLQGHTPIDIPSNVIGQSRRHCVYRWQTTQIRCLHLSISNIFVGRERSQKRLVVRVHAVQWELEGGGGAIEV